MILNIYETIIKILLINKIFKFSEVIKYITKQLLSWNKIFNDRYIFKAQCKAIGMPF